MCEQLAQTHYVRMEWSQIEAVTSCSLVQCLTNHRQWQWRRKVVQCIVRDPIMLTIHNCCYCYIEITVWAFIAMCLSWEEPVAVCSWWCWRRNTGRRKRVWWCATCRPNTAITNWRSGCRKPRRNSATGRKKETWHLGSGKCSKKKNQNYRSCAIQRLYGISCHYGRYLYIYLRVGWYAAQCWGHVAMDLIH